MKSLMQQPRVNATRQNKRFLAEPISLQRINSPKDGRRRQNYFRGRLSERVACTGEVVRALGRRRLAVEPVHLALNELPVQAFAQHQVIGRTVLHDFAKLHDDDPVETPHRR